MGVEEEEEERGGMERRRGGVEALGMRRKEEIERDMARWEGESSSRNRIGGRTGNRR